MSEEKWAAVDAYVTDLFGLADPVLDAALAAGAAAGMPDIQVSPAQGKLLELLARATRARTVLEIGTLAGYSAIWLARGLPADGRLVTLEYEPRHAEVARANLERAGFADRAEVIVGAALDTLPGLVGDGRAPFDLIFIDADKQGYPDYLTWSLRLSRPGTLIVADNVVRGGAVADPDSTNPLVRGVRRFAELVAAEPRLSATTIQTVGAKGYDGLAFALVLAD
jgi:predicted O-methyltransferase YrrM